MPTLPDVSTDFSESAVTLVPYPTKTYRLNFDGSASKGMIDGIEAMKQAIFLCLSTERFQYEMFSWNYGVEIAEKLGQIPNDWIRLQLKKTVTEALMQDDRITAVTNFQYAYNKNKTLYMSFNVETSEGNIESSLAWWGASWEVMA